MQEAETDTIAGYQKAQYDNQILNNITIVVEDDQVDAHILRNNGVS